MSISKQSSRFPLFSARELPSSSSSSSSEVNGTILSFSTDGIVWNKSKFLSSEMGAVSSDLVGNRLAQVVGINTVSYKIGSVSLFLRDRQGNSLEDFDVTVEIWESDDNGNPLVRIASASKKSSEITWTGWHTFDFETEDRPTPSSKFVSVVMWQDGGDEDNYVSWVYSSGSAPGSKAIYSSDSGATWIEHTDVVRLIRIAKSYNPFSVLCSEGVLRSSVADEAVVAISDFKDPQRDGGATYSGSHHGTVVDESDVDQSVVISSKKLIASIVVDNSGSMGWNDRGQNKVVAINEIIGQIRSGYPGDVVFDLVKFGAAGIGVPVSGGGASYASIKLDPYSPTEIQYNNDGTVPSITDGAIAAGFKNLESNHSYVLQLVKSGNVTLFNGSGLIDQNLGVRITENVQSVGLEGMPIRFSVQNIGTGAEVESGIGSPATIAEVPLVGASQVRKPSVEGRPLAVSRLSTDVEADKETISVENPTLFERGETVDIVDSEGVSCGHVVTSVNESGLDFTPATPREFGAGDTPLGGFVQQTSFYNVMTIDPNAMIELLVKDAEASRKISFFIQTPKGGRLEWDFTAMKEWIVQYITYIDNPFNLVTYLTDEDGKALPPKTRIQYYIDEMPDWEDLPNIKIFEFDPVTINQGDDQVYLPNVGGIGVGDEIVLVATNDRRYGGYLVAEVDDVDLYIRILPPLLQDSIEIKAIEVKAKSFIDRKEQKIDILFSGVDISAMKAGRLGTERLPDDPSQVNPYESNPNVYNQDRLRWLHGSFEIPVVASSTGDSGFASVRVMPVTDDHLNTETEDGDKIASIFDQSTLTDEELSEIDALEDEYAQLVEKHPDKIETVNEVAEERPPAIDNDTVNQEWILSPKESRIGEITKFTSLAKSMILEDVAGESLKFDIGGEDTSSEKGLLAKKHIVYPAVMVRDNFDNTTARYVLTDYPVYFVSPIQIFCQPESDKTVDFDMCCVEMSTGTVVAYTDTRPGVYAASGESIRMDYVVYHRGKYLDKVKMQVKIFDAFRTYQDVLVEPWSITPNLTSELGSTTCDSECTPPPNFSLQSFHKLARGVDGEYSGTIDTASNYPEAVYLDGYSEGGFEVDVINGRASFTIPAIDVVTRLIVNVEVVCPDNNGISCARTDSVWIKNPIEMRIDMPTQALGGEDVTPFEARVHVTSFQEPVTDNVSITLSGSSHKKYNTGDGSKINPESAIGQALLQIQSLVGTLSGTGGSNGAEASIMSSNMQSQLQTLMLKENLWPPTTVKPSVSKTINGTASGYMVGSHGSVTMHIIEEGPNAGSMAGDVESFRAYGYYTPPGARGAFKIEGKANVEWTGEEEQQGENFIHVSLWEKGVRTGYIANCYADGWSRIMIVADAPATKNRLWPNFDNQWISDDLVGLTRIPSLARKISVSSSYSTIETLPGRDTSFYSTRPIDPESGLEVGELDIDDSGFVGWAAVQLSCCRDIPEPKEDAPSGCTWPPCEKILVSGSCRSQDLKVVLFTGCPSEGIGGCVQTNEQGGTVYTRPMISWNNPIQINTWFDGSDTKPYNFIRDGKTSIEVWVEVDFSGKPLPMVAREHGVRDSSGAPMPMPQAILDICYLAQEWNDQGTIVKSEEFNDGTLSLTDYTPYVSVCRTSVSEGHYHSCEVDDITGNGVTTGTFEAGSINQVDNHIHSIQAFTIDKNESSTGVVHSHDPKSVAIVHINPISNSVLNICLKARVSYDASRQPVARTKTYQTCTQLEWFDFWDMELSIDSPAFVQPDVTTSDDGINITARLTHKVDGNYVPVEDGIRVVFNMVAYGSGEGNNEEEKSPTFDTRLNSPKNYSTVEVKATAMIEGKTISKQATTTYVSPLQWIPAVKPITDEPTNDSVYISEALTKVGEVKGASMLYDAIVLAADRINLYKTDNLEWKDADKIIFVLTDGCENLSQRTINQVASRVRLVSRDDRKAFVAIILFGSPSQSNLFMMGKIRDDTGGAMVRIPVGCDPSEVPDLVSALFTMGMGSFNSGSYVGTIDVGGDEEQFGTFKQACIDTSLPEGSTATFSVRFSTDGDSWTAWTAPSNLTEPTTCIQLEGRQCRYMQYIVRMTGNSSFESPKLLDLSTTYMKPSTDTIFIQPIAIDTDFDEYASEAVITHSASVPEGSEIRYGTSINNSINESSYAHASKPWFKANERSVILTRSNEPTISANSKNYVAINGGWSEGASVDVYIVRPDEVDGQLASLGSYVLNSSTGTVSFMSPLDDGSRVVLDVKPDKMIRVAIKMVNHSETPIEIGQLTVMFNKTKRFRTYAGGMIMRHQVGDDIEGDQNDSSSQ